MGTLHLRALGIYRRVEDSPWAVWVGATPGTTQDRSMKLSQLFELAAADRPGNIGPAVL